MFIWQQLKNWHSKIPLQKMSWQLLVGNGVSSTNTLHVRGLLNRVYSSSQLRQILDPVEMVHVFMLLSHIIKFCTHLINVALTWDEKETPEQGKARIEFITWSQQRLLPIPISNHHVRGSSWNQMETPPYFDMEKAGTWVFEKLTRQCRVRQ